MIKVRISCTGDDIRSIDVSGHALFDQYGKDVVCAGVSSVVIGALNALDILYPSACDLDISGNQIHIHVLKNSESIQTMLSMMFYQMKTVEESYPENIQIKRKEV